MMMRRRIKANRYYDFLDIVDSNLDYVNVSVLKISFNI